MKNTKDLLGLFKLYYDYDVGDIIFLLPANDQLLDRFALFIVDFAEQCKALDVTDSYMMPDRKTRTYLQCYLNKINNTTATRCGEVKSRVEHYLIYS